MIKARHTWDGKVICRLFSGHFLDRAFASVRIIGKPLQQKGAILLVSNHFSWWDGFIQYRLNTSLYQRRFHVMMLEEQLLQNKVLNRGGAFSIRRQSREIIESLRYAAGLLTEPDNLVLLFPQGRIESMHQESLLFGQGIDYLLERLPAGAHLIFNVNLIDYHTGRKPTLYIYHQTIPLQEWKGEVKTEEKFNEYYNRCRKEQQKIWM